MRINRGFILSLLATLLGMWAGSGIDAATAARSLPGTSDASYCYDNDAGMCPRALVSEAGDGNAPSSPLVVTASVSAGILPHLMSVPAFTTSSRLVVATEAADTSIYRGVATDHHAYGDALKGIAMPGDVGGVSDVALHNAGFTHGTDLTSWSTQLSTADGFAGNGGAVLETTVEALQRRGVQILTSPDAYNEAEVLVKGLVGGLKLR